MNMIRKMIMKIGKFKKWYKKVWKAPNDFHISWINRVKYAIHYFKPNECYWFDFEHNDYRDYISDFERVESRNINGDYKVILDDKLLFCEVFKHYIRVPEIYAWICDEKVYGMNGYQISKDNFTSFIKEKKRVVLKWTRGYEGKGTYIIEFQDVFRINGEEVHEDDIINLLKFQGEAIFCEYMYQSDFENSLYPFSTNTLRIICAKKKDDINAHIVAAVQRIGNEDSRPVDNVSAGALASDINLETGELNSAVIAKSHDEYARSKTWDNHPDTGSQIKGLIIPNWERIKKQIEELTNQFPFLNFIAWDVLLTKDGICVIEGNASAGVMMFQVREGVRNKEIGNIYRSYGIIK